MKIYIHGADNIGWSIDQDVKNLSRFIFNSGNNIVYNWWKSKIVYSVWWNNLLKEEYKYLLRFHKRIAVTCSNFIDPSCSQFNKKDEFEKMKKIAKIWIAPSHKQKNILEQENCNVAYFPFSINFNIFKNRNLSKKEICNEFNIDYEKLKNKIIIGSFQRDSLGSDLMSPKWEKNPDLLIELIKDLPRDKYILLLVGARRHYLIKKCREYNIPYIYAGVEANGDDLHINSYKIIDMPKFYELIDIYLITSKSEGGPKAAIESTAMKKFIMATDVGLCSDFIDNRFVFNNIAEYKKALSIFINSFPNKQIDEVINRNYENCLSILNDQKMIGLLSLIFKRMCD